MRYLYNNKRLKTFRRKLRKNQTKEEQLLWRHLRGKQLGERFFRQYSIGRYIADFYCPKARLVIELDGSQHLSNQKYDKKRTQYFNSIDIKVIRFWNSEVGSNIEGVLQKILKETCTS